ncbi:MAG: hypothetical protein B5M54_02035 [Candidatus Aminicenantes bacterium 4484_214]|nr:MAG: hypothetical protein B5M54_02035 [Candidatus Aminicenantes bacterium 4484_214]RLE09330.1 MAG: ABC transporter [Candidatus Aminicenantes bacterium]
MVIFNNVSYSVAGQPLLARLSWSVPAGKRIALIGANGAGKTTLLRLITGELTPQEGQIIIPKNLRIGYLPQELINFQNSSVLGYVLDGRPDIVSLEKKIKNLHLQLANQKQEDSSLLNLLGEWEEKFRALGGYLVEAQAKTFLSGLGFSLPDFRRALNRFSGGWIMRAHLARLLLQEPGLLLLDEPTNHLDLTALEWLEQYLLSFPGAIVLVSHDRFLIDRLAEDIYELEKGSLTKYPGKYRIYLQEKRKKIEQQRKKYEEQQAEKERIIRFVQKYRADKKRARQVQSRLKHLEKMRPIEPPPPLPRFDFRFQIHHPSYKDVVTMKQLYFAYETDQWLFEEIDWQLIRGEKIALIGPNGSGKTTLTRLITGELKPTKGTIRLGARTKIGHYTQHQLEILHPESTIYDEILSSTPEDRVPFIREVLGVFQFRGDDIFKKIKILSGGEKARVALAKILLSPANFLILDEPTTHLDLMAREALEEALSNYEGTVLVISHDRYFLDKIVDKVIAIQDKKLIPYHGNYSYYLAKKARPSSPSGAEAPENHPQFVPLSPDEPSSLTAQSLLRPAQPSSRRKSKEQKRREAEARQAISQMRRTLQVKIKELEQKIANLENRKKAIELKLATPQTYQAGGPQITALQKEYAQLSRELDQSYQQWEKLNQELEKLLANLPLRRKK